jgi:hypothetical protein
MIPPFYEIIAAAMNDAVFEEPEIKEGGRGEGGAGLAKP